MTLRLSEVQSRSRAAPALFAPLDIARTADEIIDIRSRALGSMAPVYSLHKETVLRHARRSGIRGFGAEVGPVIVGFAYGAPTDIAWKWTQMIASRIPPLDRESWLGASFAISELYVLPDYQGRGLGRRLATMLCESATEARALLTTPAAALHARSLYYSLGFTDLGDSIRSASGEFALMGAPLPLRRRAP